MSFTVPPKQPFPLQVIFAIGLRQMKAVDGGWGSLEPPVKAARTRRKEPRVLQRNPTLQRGENRGSAKVHVKIDKIDACAERDRQVGSGWRGSLEIQSGAGAG